MVGARPRIPGPDDHRISDIFALLNAKSEATSTGWLLEPPLESALRRGTSNLATSAEPLPFHYETLDVLVDGASASPGGNGQYSRNEPLSPDLRQPDCRHTCAALCHFDLNLSVSRLARARLVNWLWSSGMLSGASIGTAPR